MNLTPEEISKLFTTMKHLLGTTEMCPRVGWILPDGAKIDLGSPHDKDEPQRRIDHSVSIAGVFHEAFGRYPDYTPLRLGEEVGMLRTHFHHTSISPWDGVYSKDAFVEFVTPPTEAQVRALEECVCQLEPSAVVLEKVVPDTPGEWVSWTTRNAEVNAMERGCRIAMRDVRKELDKLERETSGKHRREID